MHVSDTTCDAARAGGPFGGASPVPLGRVSSFHHTSTRLVGTYCPPSFSGGNGKKPDTNPGPTGPDTNVGTTPTTGPKPDTTKPALKIKPAGTYGPGDFQHQIVEEVPPQLLLQGFEVRPRLDGGETGAPLLLLRGREVQEVPVDVGP